MLTLIELKGGYFSERRSQIEKVNRYAEKINTYYPSNPERARDYADKLIDYHTKLTSKEKKCCPDVEQWFAQFPPDEIRKKIEFKITNMSLKDMSLKERILTLSDSARLSSIYSDYSNKDSFQSLIKQQLSSVGSFEVTSLSSGNNPIVQVHNEDGNFIIRFLRVNEKEERMGLSPRVARDVLTGVEQIPKPYLLEAVAHDTLEVTYLEFSEYYKNGNLENYFKELRQQKEEQNSSPEDFLKLVLSYAQKLVIFFITINKQHVWFTDLKPSNVLLNSEYEIIISDIKGLILSREEIVPINQTSTSESYFQSNAFSGNKINLEILQRQTLATTLYQLITGYLPEQKFSSYIRWRAVFNFEDELFESKLGIFLKKLIISLNRERPKCMSVILESINKQLDIEGMIESTQLLNGAFLEELPSSRLGYSTK